MTSIGRNLSMLRYLARRGDELFFWKTMSLAVLCSTALSYVIPVPAPFRMLSPPEGTGPAIPFGRRSSAIICSLPSDNSCGHGRREVLAVMAATAGCVATVPSPAAATDPDRRYSAVLAGPFEFGFPLRAPERPTVRRELVPGRIWSFEQVQGVIYVQVPVRMTVVKLDAGGLFVYAPIAPTRECLRLLAEVEAEHGPVRHILLPTSALEHKYFAGAFADAKPAAQLWVAPYQYTFPVDLPLSLQGFPRGTRVLPEMTGSDGKSGVDGRTGGSDQQAPEWASQLPYKFLGPIKEQVGGFQEVVCFDSTTSTLLVTDLVCSIPAAPPEISKIDDRALRFHSRDDAGDSAPSTEAALTAGWRKICLFALYFQSSPLNVVSPPDGSPAGAVRFFRTAFPPEVPPDVKGLGWNGFLAWRWRPEWRAAFDAVSLNGAPLVPPIIQVAILNREPARVLAFVDAVASDFRFTRIVPAHFDAAVAATPKEWSEAFNFLRAVPLGGAGARKDLPAADLEFLRMFEAGLVRAGTIRPAAPKV